MDSTKLKRDQLLQQAGLSDDISVSDDVTRDILRVAEAAGACVDGLEWGQENGFANVADELDPEYAAWGLTAFGEALTSEVRLAFLQAVIRGPATRAARVWMDLPFLTEQEYDVLYEATENLVRFREGVASGRYLRGDTRAGAVDG